jgi:hypothetical protein
MNCEFFFSVVSPCCRISFPGPSITMIVSFLVLYSHYHIITHSLAQIYLVEGFECENFCITSQKFSFPSPARLLNEFFYWESKYVFTWQTMERNLRSSNWCLAVLFSGLFSHSIFQKHKQHSTQKTSELKLCKLCPFHLFSKNVYFLHKFVDYPICDSSIPLFDEKKSFWS